MDLCSSFFFFTKLFPERKKKAAEAKTFRTHPIREAQRRAVWPEELSTNECGRRSRETDGQQTRRAQWRAWTSVQMPRRTIKALEVTGGMVWLQRRLPSELLHKQRLRDSGYEQGDELKSYMGFLASSHAKTEAREGWNKLTLAESTAKFSSVYPLV